MIYIQDIFLLLLLCSVGGLLSVVICVSVVNYRLNRRARHATTWEDIEDLPLFVIRQHENARAIFQAEIAQRTRAN